MSSTPIGTRSPSDTGSSLTETACFSVEAKERHPAYSDALFMQKLPHLARLLNHRPASFASEGCRELRHVGHDAVNARPARRMRIRDSRDAQILRPLVLARPLRVADEETLVRSESVLWLQILPGRLLLPRDIGEQ